MTSPDAWSARRAASAPTSRPGAPALVGDAHRPSAATRPAASSSRCCGEPTSAHGVGNRGMNPLDRLLVQVVAEQSASAPAASAWTAASSTPHPALIARISSASVMTRPSKPSSSRRSPVRIRRLEVAGSSSSSGTIRCPVITALTPGGDRGAERQQRGLEVAARSPGARGASRRPCPRARGSASRTRPHLAAAFRARTLRRGERRASDRRRSCARRSRGCAGFVFASATGQNSRSRRPRQLACDRRLQPPRSARRRRRRRAPGSPGTSCRCSASSRVTSPPSSSIAIEDVAGLAAAARSAPRAAPGSPTL